MPSRLPGVLGGLASTLFAWLYRAGNAPLIVHGATQPLVQLAALGMTLAVAGAGGLAAGWIVSRVDVAAEEPYEDAVFWHEVELEHEE